MNISSLKFEPDGVGVCPRNDGGVCRPKEDAAAVVESLQGLQSLSGTFPGHFGSGEDKLDIQPSTQDICRESAPVQPLEECCKFEVDSWDSRSASQPQQELVSFTQGCCSVICMVAPGWTTLGRGMRVKQNEFCNFWTAYKVGVKIRQVVYFTLILNDVWNTNLASKKCKVSRSIPAGAASAALEKLVAALFYCNEVLLRHLLSSPGVVLAQKVSSPLSTLFLPSCLLWRPPAPHLWLLCLRLHNLNELS